MKEEIWNELYLYLIRIEIRVFKNFNECARSPCNGNHFSSDIHADNSMYCMIPDPFSTAFGKGSATPDYYTPIPCSNPCAQIRCIR